MKKWHLLFVFILAIVSCSPDGMHNERIVGNGVVQQKAILVADFYQVESNGAYEIHFIQDTLWKIDLEAESNILPLIEVYKTGNTLIIENKDNFSFELNKSIKVTIHHSGVSSISLNGSGLIDLGNFKSNAITTILSGAGSITGNIKSSQIDFILSGSGFIDAYVNCDALDASMSGQGNFIFEGTANQGVFSISGVGNIDALNLNIEKVWCNVSGVGDAKLQVSDELHAAIAGTGNIYYMGSPLLDILISGAGKVVKL